MIVSLYRCSNCFDCPSCGHTLTTRATSQLVSNPDDPGKSTPKKMYYLACGFCRWTTRDVGIPDKTQGEPLHLSRDMSCADAEGGGGGGQGVRTPSEKSQNYRVS